MIDLSGIMGIPFLRKSRFTGSDGPLRFVLERRSDERLGERLAAVCWHGPMAYAATPEEEKTTEFFPFDQEGLRQAQDWLNGRSGAAGAAQPERGGGN